jgi:hypothetical protein
METKILIGLGKSSYSNIEVNLKENENLDVEKIKGLIKQSLECVEVVTAHENNTIVLLTEKQLNIVEKYLEKHNNTILEYIDSCNKKDYKELTKDEASILIKLIFDMEDSSNPETVTPVVPNKTEETKTVTKKEPFPSNVPVDTSPLPIEEKKTKTVSQPVIEKVQITCKQCGGTNIKLDKHNMQFNGKNYDIYQCDDCPTYVNNKGYKTKVSTWIEL